METFIILASIFLFGLAIGSFLNVVIYRTLHGESPFSGRSRCPKCKRTIRAIDNIPLLSFFLLGGRCRWCKAKISWRYPVIELLTGVLFLWWFLAGSFFFRLSRRNPPPGAVFYRSPLWSHPGCLGVYLGNGCLSLSVVPDNQRHYAASRFLAIDRQWYCQRRVFLEPHSHNPRTRDGDG